MTNIPLLNKYHQSVLSARRLTLHRLTEAARRSTIKELFWAAAKWECLNEREALLINGYKCGRMSGLRSRLLWRGDFNKFPSVPLISLQGLRRGCRSDVESARVAEHCCKSAWAYQKKSSINERLQGASAAAHCTATAWKICISLSDHSASEKRSNIPATSSAHVWIASGFKFETWIC